MARIFSVRINLDEMFAQLDGLAHGKEKLQWMDGFRAGSRGAQERSNWSSVKKEGRMFGYLAFIEATKLSQRQSVKAHTLWDMKKDPPCHGIATASPRQSPEDAISSNPINHISKNEVTTGAKPPPPPEIFEGMDRDETPIELAKPIPMTINWRDWRSQHGAVFIARRGDDGDQEGWEEAFKFYGPECFDCMYDALKDSKRIYFNAAVVWLEQNTEKETA